MISKILESELELPITKVCVSVDLGEMVYPYCFIRSESLKYLVVDSTGDDGCERVVVIPKDRVLSVNVVYQQDIDSLFEPVKKDEMFQ